MIDSTKIHIITPTNTQDNSNLQTLFTIVITVILTLIAAYLIGAIPFGYLIGRWIKGIDIRQYGSGNIGATNIGRVMGWPFFVITFILDYAKGAVPVLGTQWLANQQNIPHWDQLYTIDWMTLAGLMAIIGHMWPIYLKFRGGKGVATSAGVITFLMPIPAAVAAIIWILIFITTWYVSLASMMAALALCIAQVVYNLPAPFSEHYRTLTIITILITILVWFRHRSNLVRLWQGIEPRLGQPHQNDPPISHQPSS